MQKIESWAEENREGFQLAYRHFKENSVRLAGFGGQYPWTLIRAKQEQFVSGQYFPDTGRPYWLWPLAPAKPGQPAA